MRITDYVNVFHGCGNTKTPPLSGIAAAWHPIKPLTGNTTPAATLPFGKYSVCAYSAGYTTGYGVNMANSTANPIEKLSSQMRVKGFAHFQNSGTGAIGQYYNYAVVTPYYGEKAADYGMWNECAAPGYYAVTLDETDIRCEMTVSPYAACHRYTFAAAGGRIAVDFENDGLYETSSGWLRGKAIDPAVRVQDAKTLIAAVTLQGVRLTFVLYFDGDGSLSGNGIYRQAAPGSVTVWVSVSAVGEPEALAENEKARAIPFDTARADALNAWDAALSAIEIQDDEVKKSEKEIFYSDLYHTLVKPNDWNGGSWLWSDGALVVDFSTLWDMYKTQLPLVLTLYPTVSEHIVETWQKLGETAGHFPNAFMISNRMGICRDQAQMLTEYGLYDAWKRGVKADWQKNYDVILRDIDSEDFRTFEETGKGVCSSHTLDLAGGCALLAEMAEKLGTPAEVARFRRLAENWKNVFDPATGLLLNEGKYYEGNYWTYSFRPIAQMAERVALAGGIEPFTALLDRFFGFTDAADVSGRFESFNNECDMETPYAYHKIGRMDRLIDILDAADRYIYRDASGATGRGGIPGNNDSGGMSSCYIWNTLGLFPISGQNVMLLSRPKFRQVILHLANGNKLCIRKNGNGKYPTAVSFNGVPLSDFTLSVTDMMAGGTLEYDM